MLDLANHPYFEEYVDEKSGVKSYILTKRVAEVQQQFYFTNSSLTADGKYLWLLCGNPPVHFNYLAVVSMDPNNPFFREFKFAGRAGTLEGQYPSIMPGTHDALIAMYNAIYRVSVDGEIKKLIELDNSFLQNREPRRLVSHVSVSADKKKVLLDYEVGQNWYLATGDLETGEVKLIHKFGRNYNHAQFSPTDPNLILLDQDWWFDYHSGEWFDIDNRMWIMDIRGTRFEPVLPSSWFRHDGTEVSHDFWAKDGKTICVADYSAGTYECNLETREMVHVWKRPVCHCHASSDLKYWCADQTPYHWDKNPCRIIFFDKESQKEIDIFSAMPFPREGRMRFFHMDPHPSFTEDDKYIICSTTVLDGRMDIAITPVEPLIQQCREHGVIVG